VEALLQPPGSGTETDRHELWRRPGEGLRCRTFRVALTVARRFCNFRNAHVSRSSPSARNEKIAGIPCSLFQGRPAPSSSYELRVGGRSRGLREPGRATGPSP